MCDAVYALHLERIERLVLAQYQAALVAMTFGATLTLPSLDEAFAEYDAALFAEPKRLDPEKAELLRAMGVR